ncbi:MAG TPA: hypothetical protein PLR52_10160 [Bacteroidales bacterium]|nr:hypothetical protein [Bacteroidales bacterium]HPF03235.1 hypothetical protein [Bacteroidales bacterium]HPJ59521.1 hypothetical protein [Bacteroidales bacterium]HPR12058.1 hypothetical protein [Bacteroidales bacterium]HRW85934.1 hypothetical protein [Bacteroidales bacterium]
MNNNRMLQQFHAVFGVFMVLFYVFVGIFLLFYADRMFVIDKAIRVIIGSTFLVYGLYRTYTTYKLIIKVFFRGDDYER